MASVIIVIHPRLHRFLGAGERQAQQVRHFTPPAPLRHLLETLGIPHTEVDRVLRNGRPVGLEERAENGDRVAVFPWIRGRDSTVRPARPSPVRFVVDAHLSRLAKYLRWLGFDAVCENDIGDARIARLASEECRVVLSRDRGLLMRAEILHGCYVWATDPGEQLAEVVERLQLCDGLRPFSRCLECNALLQRASALEIERMVPTDVRQWETRYLACPACHRVYWRGSHYHAMQERLGRLCPGWGRAGPRKVEQD